MTIGDQLREENHIVIRNRNALQEAEALAAENNAREYAESRAKEIWNTALSNLKDDLGRPNPSFLWSSGFSMNNDHLRRVKQVLIRICTANKINLYGKHYSRSLEHCVIPNCYMFYFTLYPNEHWRENALHETSAT